MTRKKTKILLVGVLFSALSPLAGVLPHAKAAASCSNTCIEAKLTGTVPSGVQVKAARPANQCTTTAEDTVTLNPVKGQKNTYLSPDLQPWATTGDLNPTISGGKSCPTMDQFTVSALLNGKILQSQKLTVKPGDNPGSNIVTLKITQQNVNNPTAPTTATYKACLQDDQGNPAKLFVQPGDTQPTNPVLLANGNNKYTSLILDKNGCVTFANVQAGTYALTAQITGPNAQIEYINKTGVVIAAGSNNSSSPAYFKSTGNGTSTNGTPPNTPQGSTTRTCEASGGPLSWIICGLVRATVAIEGGDGTNGNSGLEGVVKNMLQTKPFIFNANPNCDPNTDQNCSNEKLSATIYNVWSNFRLYADIVLVLALLAVVFGEAVGGGMIDAYTAKKVLPRILAAAILINLSIYIVAILEDIINILGVGIQNLLQAPFTSATNSVYNGWHINVKGGDSAVLSLGLVAMVTYGGFLLGWGGILLAVAGFGLLAILGVLITIMIRQGLLVILVLVSPVAFALYVLPNTEQYFKKWWGLLLKTLLVYPIVSAVFAMATIAGIVISNFGIQPDFLAQMMAIMATVAPIFLVPFAFKMSGGVIGSVAGAVSSISSKARKPLYKSLGKRAAERGKKGQEEALFSEHTKRGQFANTMATWALAPHKNVAYYGRRLPGLSGAGQKLRAGLTASTVEQSVEATKKMHELYGDNDKAFRLVAGQGDNGSWDTFSGKTKAGLIDKGLATGTYTRDQNGNYTFKDFHAKKLSSMDDYNKAADVLAASENATEALAADKVRASAPYLLSVKRQPGMSYADVEGAALMGLALHGFADPKDVAGYVSKHKDRDIGQAIGTKAQVFGQGQRPDLKAGYGIVFNKRTNKYDSIFDTSRQAGETDDEWMARKAAYEKRQEAEFGTLTVNDVGQAKGATFQQYESSGTIDRMLAKGGTAKQAAIDQLYGWAGPHSFASNDVKRAAMEYINRNAELREGFENRGKAISEEELHEGAHGPEDGGHGGMPEGGVPGGMPPGWHP